MMRQFIDLRRPAQLNGWFAQAEETGGETLPEVIAQLHTAGLADAQITVIQHAAGERGSEMEVAPSLFERLQALVRGRHEDVPQQAAYGYVVLTHLGEDEAKVGAVRAAFRRCGAQRIMYYPASTLATHATGVGR